MKIKKNKVEKKCKTRNNIICSLNSYAFVVSVIVDFFNFYKYNIKQQTMNYKFINMYELSQRVRERRVIN